MKTSSLQTSLAERARARASSMDISVSRKQSSRALFPKTASVRNFSPLPSRKRIDGIGADRRSFLAALRKQSPAETCIRFWRRGQLYVRRMRRLFGRVMPSFAPHKLLYGSIMGGIAFGMVSMAFLERSFGPGVFARSEQPIQAVDINPVSAGANVTSPASSEQYDPEQDVFFEYFGQTTKEKYEESIRNMVKGYPIEAMLPDIFSQDRLTAAFLIGIAKKESNWGRRIPVLEDQDCFNYWGYRGIRRMMGSGGHTCFNSRKDAVETVASRLEKLIHSQKLDTPEKMIVWKCGFSCQGHSRESVMKWISDVDMYFSQASGE